VRENGEELKMSFFSVFSLFQNFIFQLAQPMRGQISLAVLNEITEVGFRVGFFH